MTIGERIKLIREGRGISQPELAEAAKTTKQTIYKYENNLISNIPSDKIEAIAQYLKVTPAYLMGWDDDNDIGNKVIFSRNLRRYISISGKTRFEICQDLNIKYSTFSEWVSGKKYPRIDNIERLANYFGITKSALIENPRQNQSTLEKMAYTVSEQLEKDIDAFAYIRDCYGDEAVAFFNQYLTLNERERDLAYELISDYDLEEIEPIVFKYNKIDSYGKKTVEAVLNSEFDRHLNEHPFISQSSSEPMVARHAPEPLKPMSPEQQALLLSGEEIPEDF